MNQAIQNDLNATKQAEITDLETVKRISSNALALLTANDVLIPASHARALPEIQAWLEFMFEQVSNKLAELKPKSDVASTGQEASIKAIDAEVVTEAKPA